MMRQLMKYLIDESETIRERQEIVTKYVGVRASNYSNETMMTTCHSISQFKDFASFNEPVAETDAYNP